MAYSPTKDFFSSFLEEVGLEIHSLVKTKTPKIEGHRYQARTDAHFRRLFSVIREYLDALDRGRFNYRPGWGCAMCDFRESHGVGRGDGLRGSIIKYHTIERSPPWNHCSSSQSVPQSPCGRSGTANTSAHARRSASAGLVGGGRRCDEIDGRAKGRE